MAKPYVDDRPDIGELFVDLVWGCQDLGRVRNDFHADNESVEDANKLVADRANRLFRAIMQRFGR